MADFSEFLNVSVSSDGRWYRFYLKDMHLLIGHIEYRDFDNDGELSRLWISENVDPQNARSHPYSILAYLNTSTGKVYGDNKDFGFSTTADRDLFGSKTNLVSRQRILGSTVIWEPMKRQSEEKEKQKMVDDLLPVPSRSWRVARNLNLNRRGAPGSGWQTFDVRRKTDAPIR